MASGVPVVAPAAGGPLDLVDHGRTGLLVPPHDARRRRDAVRALRPPPGLRAAYGRAGRATVEGRTWAAVGDQLLGHYADVVGARTAVVAHERRCGSYGWPTSSPLPRAACAPPCGNWAAGYLAAGHDPVLIVPGERAVRRDTAQGRVITVPGPVLPGTGGYRVLTDKRRVSRPPRRARTRPARGLRPDDTAVDGRVGEAPPGPAMMVSHETADGVLRTWGVPGAAAGRAADRLNLRSAWAYSRIVCTTEWAEREFLRIGARNVVRAPLGVDLERCQPGCGDSEGLRSGTRAGRTSCCCSCSRLSVEKRPGDRPRRAGGAAGAGRTGGAGRGRRRAAARRSGTAGHVPGGCRSLSSDMSATAGGHGRPPGGGRHLPGAGARRDLRARGPGGPRVRHAGRRQRVVGAPEVVGDAGSRGRRQRRGLRRRGRGPAGPPREGPPGGGEGPCGTLRLGPPVAAFLAAHEAPARRYGRPVRPDGAGATAGRAAMTVTGGDGATETTDDGPAAGPRHSRAAALLAAHGDTALGAA